MVTTVMFFAKLIYPFKKWTKKNVQNRKTKILFGGLFCNKLINTENIIIIAYFFKNGMVDSNNKKYIIDNQTIIISIV